MTKEGELRGWADQEDPVRCRGGSHATRLSMQEERDEDGAFSRLPSSLVQPLGQFRPPPLHWRTCLRMRVAAASRSCWMTNPDPLCFWPALKPEAAR